MEAGRELDALVAEKVMGWTTIYGANEEGEEYAEFLDGDGKEVGWVYGELADLVDLPAYSTDIAAAWKVVERLQGDHMQVTVMGNRRLTRCMIVRGILEIASRDADTAPLAICLAALAAVGATLPQKATDA